MRKTYIIPGMTVVHLQHQGIICQSGVVNSVSNTEGFTYGGGGSGEAYTKESNGAWDDEW